MTKMAKSMAIIGPFVAIGLSFCSLVIFEQHHRVNNYSVRSFIDVLDLL